MKRFFETAEDSEVGLEIVPSRNKKDTEDKRNRPVWDTYMHTVQQRRKNTRSTSMLRKIVGPYVYAVTYWHFPPKL